MKVKWLGHASFLITSEKGTRIITDPYVVSGPIKYGEIKEAADVVTVSHEHSDHNNISAIGGKPQVYKGGAPLAVKDVKISGVSTFHDENKGKDRGPNVIFCMEMDGMRLCHLGDLGHPLSPQEISQIGKVDVLLIPVGGFFTINAAVASEVSTGLNPKAIIPMHFKNDKCGYPIAAVDDFLKGKENVTKLDESEVEFKADRLPNVKKVIVLKPSL
jgi:L-ascorbate metabolism protein UlaG (beta-lactamase superfamily)